MNRKGNNCYPFWVVLLVVGTPLVIQAHEKTCPTLGVTVQSSSSRMLRTSSCTGAPSLSAGDAFTLNAGGTLRLLANDKEGGLDVACSSALDVPLPLEATLDRPPWVKPNAPAICSGWQEGYFVCHAPADIDKEILVCSKEHVTGENAKDGQLGTRQLQTSIWRVSELHDAASTGPVLVMDLKAVGVKIAQAQTMTAQVANAISVHPALTALTLADLHDVLELSAEQSALGCEADIECLTKISKAAKAKLLLHGSLGELGGQKVLNLSLIRTKDARVQNRVSGPIRSGSDAVRADVTALVAELFGLRPQSGPRFSLGEALKASAHKGRAMSFAVFPLKPAGVTEEVALNLTQVLSTQIKSIEGTSVIGKDDIAALLQLETDKAQLGCEADASCLAEIGGALGVDKLVVGQVGQLAGSYVISLRLIDAKEVFVANRVSETFAGDAAQLLGAVRTAGRNLLGVQTARTGTLVVTTSVEQAELFVDGEKRGMLPAHPLSGLSVGRHSLRIHKVGYVDQHTDIYVEPDAVSVAWAELLPQPSPPWYASWKMWAATGGLSAVAVAGVSAATALWFYSQPSSSDLGAVTLKTGVGN